MINRYQSTRCHVEEDLDIHHNRGEDLKSRKIAISLSKSLSIFYVPYRRISSYLDITIDYRNWVDIVH